MKRFIRAAASDDIIFEDSMFIFKSDSGIGMNDTPWDGLAVVTKRDSLASKHVVEIRLITKGWHDFNGEPVHYTYSGCNVSHGMRGTVDTLEDTAEYIEVLEDALEFAYRVDDWLAANQ